MEPTGAWNSSTKWLKRVMVLLPVVGAVGAPFYAGGEYSWLVKALLGLLIGGSLSMMLLRSFFVPPFSTAISAFAALLMFASIGLLAAFAPGGSLGTAIVGAIVAAGLFWALTR